MNTFQVWSRQGPVRQQATECHPLEAKHCQQLKEGTGQQFKPTAEAFRHGQQSSQLYPGSHALFRWPFLVKRTECKSRNVLDLAVRCCVRLQVEHQTDQRCTLRALVPLSLDRSELLGQPSQRRPSESSPALPNTSRGRFDSGSVGLGAVGLAIGCISHLGRHDASRSIHRHDCANGVGSSTSQKTKVLEGKEYTDST